MIIPVSYPNKKTTRHGLQLLWITPLRALAKDIGRAMEEVIDELGIGWKVGIRNGDTSIAERQKQKLQMPEVLIITPESLHLLLAQKGYEAVFSSMQIIAVDEWHELIGSKRGVQVELAVSRIAGSRLSVQSVDQSAVGSSQSSVVSQQSAVQLQFRQSSVGSSQSSVNSNGHQEELFQNKATDSPLTTHDSRLATDATNVRPRRTLSK